MDLAFFTFSVYLPSKSVMVPLVVPFSTILAPMTGSPVASFTIPVMVCPFCCKLTGAAFSSFEMMICRSEM